MSKTELFRIVKSPYNELIKVKIGKLVRATLPEILELELISKLEVDKMTREDYSKMVFDMNYPVLRLIDETKSLKQNRYIGDYPRYYASTSNFNGKRYLISSEWYDRNQEDYIKWMKRKVRE